MEFLLGLGKVLWTLLQVIILFNILIVVHELGHYWAAKWRGLKVEKFQIWFGKPIWKKKIKEVQWGLGWIPMGGFVALPQMAPMEMLEGKNEGKESLPPIKPIDKQSILDFLASKVAKWWLPDEIIFLQELPHGATGKLQKFELRDEYNNYYMEK